ncbi:hypothetical protein FY134_24165 (plasmid) [Agrobacterium fabrum]|nr:hypothetical protein [Agrobacterium fabrum]UXT60785.1 hypothetical protein FY134_24165 [Agrobacterium fabrum]
MPADKALFNQLHHSRRSTSFSDSRLSPTDAVSKINDTDRPQALDHNQQRKQRAVQRDPHLPDHMSITLRRPVHRTDDVEQRAVQIA